MSRVDGDGNTVPGKQGVIRLALWFPAYFDAFHALRKRCQHDFTLHTGNGLPYAAMNAHAEANVTIGIATNIKAVGVFPAPGVAVGRAEKQQHLLALGYARTGNLDIAGCSAEESLHWRLPAYRFVNVPRLENGSFYAVADVGRVPTKRCLRPRSKMTLADAVSRSSSHPHSQECHRSSMVFLRMFPQLGQI